MIKISLTPVFIFLLLITELGFTGSAYAKKRSREVVKTEAEEQIKSSIEPVLHKYCHEDCKLMSVDVSVDIVSAEELAPGFDEFDGGSSAVIEPTGAKIKLILDEKIGPNSRTRLLGLIQEYIKGFSYPIKVDAQTVKFPVPAGASSKVASMREKITKQHKSTMEEIFARFCPDQCMLTDFNLQTEVVNPEEIQYGQEGEYFEEGGVAIRVTNLSSTVLTDDTLTAEERANILEITKLKTNTFKNTTLALKTIRFPQPRYDQKGNYIGRSIASTPGSQSSDSKESKETSESKINKLDTTHSKNESNTNNIQNTENSSKISANSIQDSKSLSNNERKDRFEKYEKIERVENGDEVQKEIKKITQYALIFGGCVLFLLAFLIVLVYAKKEGQPLSLAGLLEKIRGTDAKPDYSLPPGVGVINSSDQTPSEASNLLKNKYEIQRIKDELLSIFSNNPKVAKDVFTRVLTEDGVEVTAAYLNIFGESIVLDMLRDPSLHTDLNELMEYYSKNPFELTDEETLDVLKKLHNRTVVSKMHIFGRGSTGHFDYLAEMDGSQILELIRSESITVKAIVLTQCDNQKRATIFAALDEATRSTLLSELSRIDYLPREYINNVANSLNRKRKTNPVLNTEALPGSDVLVSLLEKSKIDVQKAIVSNLEMQNPNGARNVKGKLVSLDTLRYLNDGQLLEVVLSLKHDELLRFLKGSLEGVRNSILSKCPSDLAEDLDEELQSIEVPTIDAYQNMERKILNRIKIMAKDGVINLVETNERIFSEKERDSGFVNASSPAGRQATPGGKVSGW